MNDSQVAVSSMQPVRHARKSVLGTGGPLTFPRILEHCVGNCRRN